MMVGGGPNINQKDFFMIGCRSLRPFPAVELVNSTDFCSKIADFISPISYTVPTPLTLLHTTTITGLCRHCQSAT